MTEVMKVLLYKLLTSVFLLVMEIMMKYCWGFLMGQPVHCTHRAKKTEW